MNLVLCLRTNDIEGRRARWVRGFGAAVLAVLLAAAAPAQSEVPTDGDGNTAPEHATPDRAEPRRTAPWDPEIVALVSRLPIQDQGRVKPFSSYARFTAMNLNGREVFEQLFDQGTKTASDDVEVKLTPVELLLDFMFFPRQAQEYRCFQLQTWEVLDAIGVDRIAGRKKRDRYNYNEIASGRDELFRQYRELRNDPAKREAKNRTYLENQVYALAGKVNEFEGLLGALSIGMSEFVEAPADPQARRLLGVAGESGGTVAFSKILSKSSELSELRNSADEPAVAESIAKLQDVARVMANYSSLLTIWPPDAKPAPRVRTSMYNSGPAEVVAGGSSVEQWYGLDEVHRRVVGGDTELLALHLPAIEGLEAAWKNRTDQGAIKRALEPVVATLARTAEGREQYRKIESEVSYQKAAPFHRALGLFVLSFVLIAIGWLIRGTTRYHRMLPWAVALPLALTIGGIVWRGYLRARPPVSNLYETIPFITAGLVLVCLIIEWIDRKRIAVAVASVLGAAGMFLTARYEVKEAFERGNETMPQLQAVLDTNFWLATHVTTVTLGYAAGLLAAALGLVYVGSKLVGAKNSEEAYYKPIARMVYGVLCFGLLFSIVGTILGGVWAADSWGRFWGWDPKENGALMICLFELAILHARMGGYVRDLGMCTAAIFGANIVTFSWWGVNQLGVGLHAYGETDGVDFWLNTAYTTLCLATLAGLWLAAGARSARQRPADATQPH
jgi:ABC-type transport system involved in cytochrome c biogenesis permease subunit